MASVTTSTQRSRRARRAATRLLKGMLSYAVLIVLSVIFLAPLFWMVSTALKTDEQLFLFPPKWIPEPAVWSNFPKGWAMRPFNTYLRNTLIITIFAMTGQIISSSAVAFGFARLRFPGRNVLFMGVLATMMLPGVVTMIPVYLLFRKLDWVDTFLPLIVPAYFGGGAFFIFLLRQFFMTIPVELSDAAKIDGCSDFSIYARIMLPLCRPALATVAIFSFMGHWNDFMGPLIYLNTQEKKTITLGLQEFIGTTSTQFQYLMAVSTLTVLPVVVIFFVAQRQFIRGVVMTGITGV